MRPLAPRPRPRSRSTQLAVAAALLAIGWAFLVRGAAHPGVAYRPWAFDHHAYSDLLAMAGDRYFHGGRPTPYLEDRIEYPPLHDLAVSPQPGMVVFSGTRLLARALFGAARL